MAKVSRNQPCPCGSGKKYKHCCGKTPDLADFRKGVLERETEQLIHRIYHRFAAEWFKKVPQLLKEVMGDTLQRLPQISKTIDNLFEKALEGAEGEVLELLNEYILFDYTLPNRSTIFNQYFKKEQRKMRPVVEQTVSKWLDSHVSVFEILAVADSIGTFKDIFTGQEYKIDLHVAQSVLENITEGDLLMSRRLAKGDIDEITGFFPIFRGLKEELMQRLQQSKEAKGISDWSKYLKAYGYEVIVTGYEMFTSAQVGIEEGAKDLEESLDWTNEKYYEVAQEIRTRLLESDYNLENVYVAITMWHRYCALRSPKITKVETMLAAVEYFMSQQLEKNVTQKDIATKYGISPTTVSSRYREFYEAIEEDLAARQ